jgi:hypothetical protein
MTKTQLSEGNFKEKLELVADPRRDFDFDFDFDMLLCPRANPELVHKFHISLQASHANVINFAPM